MNRRQGLNVLLSFLAGVAVALVAPRLILAAANVILFPDHHTEIMRVTSPDGTVDAVAERIDCGALCSSNFAVSIVPKGGAALSDPVQQVFIADDMVNAKIVWKESHLLEIAYDRAFIHSFRNVSNPLGRPGNVESWQYEVEIRLAPSSTRFSYLSE
jgi:hypothetical protein